MTPRRLLFLFLVFILPFSVPALSRGAEGKPSKKKTSAKRKTFDYEKSKYKSLEPSQTPTYKFNERGEPIRADAKKKASVKKKKRSEPPEAGMSEGAEACGSDESCAEKKAEADAL